MTFETLFRTNIRTLRPYRSAREDVLEGLLLDANENSCGSVLREGIIPLNRYPDPKQRALRQRLADLEGVELEQVFVGAGSDEIIDLLFRITCEPRQDRVMLLEPTYGMYRVTANIHDVPCDSVMLDDTFQVNMDGVLTAIGPRTKLLFCCSPNNPTGNELSRRSIFGMCDATNGLVVVDEAYVDFSGNGSLASAVNRRRNLVVLKTLSKSWGLAGIRLGYCVADRMVVETLFKVKAPYNINTLTSAAALRALERSEERDRLVGMIVAERDRLSALLPRFSFVDRVFASKANFLLVRVISGPLLYAYLRSCGIVVRDRSTDPGLQDCLRITVGTVKENDMLLKALSTYAETHNAESSK